MVLKNLRHDSTNAAIYHVSSLIFLSNNPSWTIDACLLMQEGEK